MIRSFNATLTDDPDFQDRSVEARLVFFQLWNHTKNHCCGLIQISIASLAADVRLQIETTKNALAELEKYKLIRTQLERNLIWVPGMRALLGAIGPKIRPTIEKYLRSIRPCALVKEVADSCEIPYDLPESKSGYPIPSKNPSPDTLLDPNTKDLIPKTDPDSDQQDSDSKPRANDGLFGTDTPAALTKPKADPIDQQAREVLEALSAARKRVKPSCHRLEPSDLNLREIKGRLKDDLSQEKLMHVVAVWEALVRAGKRDMEHFNQTSPFLRGNVTKYTDMDLDDARQPSRFGQPQVQPGARFLLEGIADEIRGEREDHGE